MIKESELSNPDSCLNKAKPGELLFILLSRDPAAPAAIRYWVANRIRRGLNGENDQQIKSALLTADLMEKQQLRYKELGS